MTTSLTYCAIFVSNLDFESMSQIMQTLRKLATQWRDGRSGSGPQMADRDRAQCPAGIRKLGLHCFFNYYNILG